MPTIREKLTNWFRSSSRDEDTYYDDETDSLPEVNSTPTTEINPLAALAPTAPMAATPAPAPPVVTTTVNAGAPFEPQPKVEIEIPYWLEDEDTLRDEGVLFGLSESEPTEKTDIIHKYFSHLVAEHLGEIEQQNERIQELNLFIGQKTSRIDALEDKLKNFSPENSTSEHQLPRTLIGLGLSVAMCVGNFYLIRESLKPAFQDASWIALGVFLAGMFSLFGRISLFHDTDSKVSWRSLMEEIGMPFASALFVFANVVPHQTWLQAIALFVFVFFLFLFAGKLFLSNITVLRNDLKIWSDRHQVRTDALTNTENCEADIVGLQEEIDELRVKKWQILREQNVSETERDRLYARRDMLIKLFESEFYLARRMKGQLSGKQLNYIKGEK